MAVAFAIAPFLLLHPSSAVAQTDDVPRDHWAYDAVQDLASKGYVLGYSDANFLGNRTLTRYEFATIMKRVVDNLAMPGPPAGE